MLISPSAPVQKGLQAVECIQFGQMTIYICVRQLVIQWNSHYSNGMAHDFSTRDARGTVLPDYEILWSDQHTNLYRENFEDHHFFAWETTWEYSHFWLVRWYINLFVSSCIWWFLLIHFIMMPAGLGVETLKATRSIRWGWLSQLRCTLLDTFDFAGC